MIFAGFFLYYSPQPTRISEALMGGAEVGGNIMINITIRELYYTFADFFPKQEFIFFKGEKNIFLRVQRSLGGPVETYSTLAARARA